MESASTQYGCVTSGPAAPVPVESSPESDLGKLAYVAEGNLWVRTLPDGASRQLTTDGASESPRWSPSSEWLALHKSDDKVWVMRETGEDARALEGTGPYSAYAWSPITDTVAFIGARGNLAIASAPDWQTQEVVTVRDEQGYMFPFVWSRDGEWLTYEDDHLLAPVREGEYPLRYTSLQKIRSDGRAHTELVNAGNPSAYGLIPAGWSREGQVYFEIDPVCSGSLLADGTQLDSVSPNGATTLLLRPETGMLAYRDFWSESPDGKRVAVTAGGGRETWSNKRIASINLSTAELTYLTESKTAAFSPAWSPDGERLAFVSAPALDPQTVWGGDVAKEAAGQRRIWIMHGDGSDQHPLTNGPNYRDEFPQWSRDGTFILFARLDALGEASIWIVPSDGGTPQQVAGGMSADPLGGLFGYYGHLDWTRSFDWWKGR